LLNKEVFQAEVTVFLKNRRKIKMHSKTMAKLAAITGSLLRAKISVSK
jgi:hypothetical protein